ILTRFHYSSRRIVPPLLIALLFYLAPPPLLAQEKGLQRERIENARWAIVEGTVVINYDLVAKPDVEYEVKIVLKRESDRNFSFTPKTVSGAIGEGKHAGVNKEIRWSYMKDLPSGIYGDGYFFEFSVDVVESSSWYYYALGALAVIGGGGAYFLGKPKTGGDSTVPQGLPEAPKTRPNQ
ncbi:MAG: hypothetical protein V1799_04565, partial [bacterium]